MAFLIGFGNFGLFDFMKRPARNLLDWFQCAAGWWALFFLWALGLTIATCIPGRDLPTTPFPDFDKAVHFTAFLVGAVVLFPAIRLASHWRLLAVAGVTFVLISVYGIMDEFKQLWVPGRKGGDWADIAANSLGAAVGVIMLWLIYGYSIGRSKNARRLAPKRD